MQTNHERERSACLRGATDYNKMFGKGERKTNQNFATIADTVWG